MLLVDTSAWVNHFRGAAPLIELAREEEFATCPPIVQEVLNGAGPSASYHRLRSTLLDATLLDDPMPLERFEYAAQIYLRCRAEGVTIRSSVDCLIAACAITYDAEVIHNDDDFERIAEHTTLKARRVTPSPA